MALYYSAFELNISSDFEFPELLSGYPLAATDCIIRKKNTPELSENPKKIGVTYQVSPHFFYLNIPHIGCFAVKNGQSISVTPAPQIDEATLRLFILGPCLSALLLQQGKYVLNGHVLATQGYAYGLLGHSGVGKSTLAQALLTHGHTLLSSGLCVIDQMGQALPGYPRLPLWSDALHFFSITTPLSQIRPVLEKWYVHTDDHFQHTSLPFKAAYFLGTHNQSDIQINPIKGFEKFNILKNNTTHLSSTAHMIDLKTHQRQGMILANQIRMIKLIRPDKKNTIDVLVERIKHDLKTEGQANDHE